MVYASFTFKWPRFSDDFHHDAREMLEAALNKGNKPPIIADRIEVIELEMGTQAGRNPSSKPLALPHLTLTLRPSPQIWKFVTLEI